MSASPVFVDTNILVYAHDRDAGEKHRIAREKIASLWKEPLPPSISIQVLQEFYVNLIRKDVPTAEARQTVVDYLDWNVVDNDRALLLEGIHLRERWQVSFWDALILAAAQRAGTRSIWSEDLNTGQDYGGVVAVNPLSN